MNKAEKRLDTILRFRERSDVANAIEEWAREEGVEVSVVLRRIIRRAIRRRQIKRQTEAA